MRPENINRTFRVPAKLLDSAHAVCADNNVKLSTVIRRYAQQTVRTAGSELITAPCEKFSQLNVRMPFDLAHSFSQTCRDVGRGSSTAVTDLLIVIAENKAIPDELMQDNIDDMREYIRKERARLDALEEQLGIENDDCNKSHSVSRQQAKSHTSYSPSHSGRKSVR